MANHYEVPNWAGKPPVGLHLDVLKGDKLIQKLMIDEKKCYLFGRNAQMNDFCIDHASCSRVHAAFVYHKNLERAFLVDLGSTHGTFIGTMRLEPHKPTQLPIDSTFHFGASTRHYVIRERPQAGSRPIIDELERSGMGEDVDGGLLGLPETEIELDNLTEFNTAHNRRISMLGITDATDSEKNTSGGSSNRKRSRRGVSFNEDEEVINPEDVDPSVGRFRNLVHSTVVPSAQKRARLGSTGSDLLSGNLMAGRHQQPQTAPLATGPSAVPHLYHGLPPEAGAGLSAGVGAMYSSLSARLGLVLPNPAPDVEMGEPSMPGSGGPFAAALPHGSSAAASAQAAAAADALEPRKKKYAKEAWPGKKPAPALF